VISTEAAHAFVSSGAEKSASLPIPLHGPYSVFAVACPPFPSNKKHVISTEAAHAFVSSEAEKSASLPIPLHGPYSVFPVACPPFPSNKNTSFRPKQLTLL